MFNLNKKNDPANFWTHQELIHLNNSLASVYGLGQNQPDSSKASDTWTTKELLNMSANLARAFCPGL